MQVEKKDSKTLGCTKEKEEHRLGESRNGQNLEKAEKKDSKRIDYKARKKGSKTHNLIRGKGKAGGRPTLAYFRG